MRITSHAIAFIMLLFMAVMVIATPITNQMALSSGDEPVTLVTQDNWIPIIDDSNIIIAYVSDGLVLLPLNMDDYQVFMAYQIGTYETAISALYDNQGLNIAFREDAMWQRINPVSKAEYAFTLKTRDIATRQRIQRLQPSLRL